MNIIDQSQSRVFWCGFMKKLENFRTCIEPVPNEKKMVIIPHSITFVCGHERVVIKGSALMGITHGSLQTKLILDYSW